MSIENVGDIKSMGQLDIIQRLYNIILEEDYSAQKKACEKESEELYKWLDILEKYTKDDKKFQSIFNEYDIADGLYQAAANEYFFREGFLRGARLMKEILGD